MECLQAVLENEYISNYIDKNERKIYEMTSKFHAFPEIVKQYVVENLDDFVGDDLNETYENIKSFVSNSVFQYMHSLCEEAA